MKVDTEINIQTPYETTTNTEETLRALAMVRNQINTAIAAIHAAPVDLNVRVSIHGTRAFWAEFDGEEEE